MVEFCRCEIDLFDFIVREGMGLCLWFLNVLDVLIVLGPVSLSLTGKLLDLTPSPLPSPPPSPQTTSGAGTEPPRMFENAASWAILDLRSLFGALFSSSGPPK